MRGVDIMARFPRSVSSGSRACLAVAALFTGLVTACVRAPAPDQPSPRSALPASSESSRLLQRIVDDYWAEASQAEDIPDISFAKVQAEATAARSRLRSLDTVNTAELSHDEWVTLEVLRWEARVDIAAVDLYWYSSPIMPANSPLRGARVRLAAKQFESRDDLDRHLEALEDYAALLHAMRDKVSNRAERGIVLPAEQIDRVLPFLRSVIQHPDASMFAVPRTRLERFSPSEIDDFERRVADRITSSINPAAQALARYVDEEIRPLAPAAVGIGQYPGGKEAYRALVKLQTTLEVTPEEVHAIGLRAVADINAQMQAIRDQLGFQGTKAEFHDRLRKDPRFYVNTPEAFGQRLLEFDARLRPHLDDYFLRRPRTPHSVQRLDPSLEASMTYGFYQWATEADSTGYYNYNGSKLDQRSLLSGAGLTYHELMPGHHFQIGLQREHPDLPEFRRLIYYAGYGEGWGEYSSSVVAREMGMYKDPYDLYGRLVFDMFFAVRLVVDTGMNYYGWSRRQAMEYMREHTMESDVQIDSETIRYSTRSPAQALAYRMGRETFVNLRAKAERALGERFDIRRFHEAILGSGPMPLTVLEQHIDWFIKRN